MALNLASASSQYLLNAAPVLPSLPFTVGLWVNMAAVSTLAQCAWALSDSGTTTHYYLLGVGTTEIPSIIARGGGTAAAGTTGASLLAGTWNYILGRFISITNRRISCLYHSGAVLHGVNVTSTSPSGLDNMTLGCQLGSSAALFWGGGIAEYFIMTGDIQAEDADTKDALVRQMAHKGPLSDPNVVKRLIEYRSFNGAHAWGGSGNDIFWGGAQQIWSNPSGSPLGPHPPLNRGLYRRCWSR